MPRRVAGFCRGTFVIDTPTDRIVGSRDRRPAKTDFVFNVLGQGLHDQPLFRRAGCTTTRSAEGNICLLGPPSIWLEPGANRLSTVSATRMTKFELRRLTGSTIPNWPIGRRRDATCQIWKWPHSDGSIGSKTNACSAPSETFRQQRLKTTSMHSATCSIFSSEMKL